ncbi:MAG: hypothetical protein H6509_10835 [Bryobacterales bacterium]|nr:hypothetical protein [Bryobacterales bacterium]
MEKRRRCGWLDENERGEERVVWASRETGARGERVSTTECPVSAISGESRAAVEGWLAELRIGTVGEVERRPARTVDAWLTLAVEKEAAERQRDGD